MHIPILLKNCSKKISLIIIDKKNTLDSKGNKKFNFLQGLSSVILAISTVGLFIATVALVKITHMNIKVSQKMVTATEEMAEQTRRMAEYTKYNTDTLIEQFKMKSYPSLLIDATQSYAKPEGYEIILHIINKGEITAYGANTLLVNAYKQNQKYFFFANVAAYYGSKEENTSLDYSKDYLKDSRFRITMKGKKYDKEHKMDDLKNLLLIIKFKVPYSDKYQYEEFAFEWIKNPLHKNDISTKILQEVSDNDSTFLMKKYLTALIKSTKPVNEKIRSFFIDYKEGVPIYD